LHLCDIAVISVESRRFNLLSSANSSLFNLSNYTNASSQSYGYASELYYHRPENSILFIFLMLATLWVGMTLIKFDES